MRKFLWLAIAGTGISISSIAQDSTTIAKDSVTITTITPAVPTTTPKKDWTKVNLGNRANDHFMIQFGLDGWAGAPDSINISGFSRHFNFYLMYDKPFKTAPRLSVAAGVGLGTSSIFFEKTNIDIAGKTGASQIRFINATSNYFKKYKLNTTWVEVPIELRFVSDPLHSGKSWKMAIGAKIGTMIESHTKGKNLVGASDNSLYGTKYVEKEKSKKYFNSTRLAATMRAGYGPVTIYGAYQVTNLFKEAAGPTAHPYSIGLCLSGL
ncbi:MAG: hypothetical protein V4717_15110 [Bacteroidota bacterium]